jgi:predicted DNA-binding transcriptional regulator AlpA
MHPHPTILLDERAAAAALGLTPRTLQGWRHRGDGPPHVRISARCVRYRVEDLNAWAAQRVRTSTSDPGRPGPD